MAVSLKIALALKAAPALKIAPALKGRAIRRKPLRG